MKRMQGLAICAALSVLALGGCGKAKTPTTDSAGLAASVNGQPIMAKELQDASAKLGIGPNVHSTAIDNQVLKTVIDQELLAQQAVKGKLDEQSDIKWRLAVARRQVLAQAELENLTDNVPEPSKDKVQAYFNDHPELFSHRRVYHLVSMVADVTGDNLAKAQAIAKKGKDVKKMLADFKAAGIKVAGQQVVKPAEDLPSSLLKKLADMKAGQSVSMVDGDKLDIVFVKEAKDQPVTLEQASPSISRFLQNEKKRAEILAELKKLKSEAKIEYHPPYSAAGAANGNNK